MFRTIKVTLQLVIVDVYIATKGIFSMFEILKYQKFEKFARAHPNYSVSCLAAICSGMVCGCGCCCLCCCDCCHRKPGRWRSSLTYYIHLTTKFNCYLVKTLLGSGEGVVEKSAAYKREDHDSFGVSKLYIRNKALSHREISNFALIIYSFGLLALVTLWNSVLKETSMSTCSIEPNRYCFPLLNDQSTNITDATDQPITDCSYWNNEAVAGHVTFLCYQWMFNLADVIGNFGGFLTIFVLAMKVLSSAVLAVVDLMVEKCVQLPGEEPRCCKRKLIAVLGIVRLGRIVLAYVLYFIEIFSAVGISIYSMRSNKNVEIGFEIVLVSGVLSSGLLLPLEEYALVDESSGGTQSSLEHSDSQHYGEDPHNPLFDSVPYERAEVSMA